MNATPAQVTAALDLFTKRHPPHADLNGVHRSTHPDPTTDHIMVACGCGYRWRYGARELAVACKTAALTLATLRTLAIDTANSAHRDLACEEVEDFVRLKESVVEPSFRSFTVRPFVRTPKPT